MKNSSGIDRRKFLRVMAAGTCGAVCHHMLQPLGLQAFAANTPGNIKNLVQIYLYGGVSGYGMFPQHNVGAQAKMGTLFRTPAQAVPLHHPDLSMHLAFANLAAEVTLSKLAVVTDVGALTEAGDFSRSHDEAQTATQDLNMRYNLATSVGIGAALAQAIGDPFGAISFEGSSHFFENGAIPARSISSLGTGRDHFSGDDYYLYMENSAKSLAAAPRSAQQQKVKNAIVGMNQYIQTLQNLASINLPVAMPNTNLGNKLEDLGRLLTAGIGNIFSVSQGGYDTHQNQAAQHQTLFTELSNALTNFVKNLKLIPGRSLPTAWEETVVIVNSDFGRTDANGSQPAGTDHGHGRPTFLIGGRVIGATYGTPMDAVRWQNNPRNYIGPENLQFNVGQPFKEIGLAMGLPNIWPNYIANVYSPLGLIQP